MMQKDVMPPKFFEQILRLRRQPQLPRGKAAVLEIGTLNLVVNVEHARKVHWPGHRENLPGIELKHRAQTIDDFRIGVRLDLEAYGVALASVMQFGAYRFQQAARLFFLQVEIAVAGHAEG